MTHDIRTNLHPADELCVDGKAELHRVNGIKQPLLILLQVLVVGEWEPLHCREHRHEMTDDASRFATHEFGDIRVLLLGHHGGACAVCIVQLDKGELTRAPEDDLLRET